MSDCAPGCWLCEQPGRVDYVAVDRVMYRCDPCDVGWAGLPFSGEAERSRPHLPRT